MMNQLGTEIINKIYSKFGKPTIFIAGEKLLKLKEGIFCEEDLGLLELDSRSFYEQWHEFVHKKYKNGNSTSICLSCYTFIKKGQKVIYSQIQFFYSKSFSFIRKKNM